MAAVAMLDALRIKPFDLHELYTSWDADKESPPPRFEGKKNDDPVAFLNAIKNGCKARKVPKDYWYRVGRHYLGLKPRERLDELGKVMQKMTGQTHVWNWKKFKIAVQNIGWSSPNPKSKTMAPPVAERVSERPVPKKQGSWWILGKSDSNQTTPEKEKDLKDASKASSSKGSTEIVVAKTAEPEAMPSESNAMTVAKAPAWLINACGALEYLTVEHPHAMSAMSAILLTVGAIPSIPAVAGGAGGAILASGAAKAVGAIAISVGQALKLAGETKQNQQQEQQQVAQVAAK